MHEIDRYRPPGWLSTIAGCDSTKIFHAARDEAEEKGRPHAWRAGPNLLVSHLGDNPIQYQAGIEAMSDVLGSNPTYAKTGVTALIKWRLDKGQHALAAQLAEQFLGAVTGPV